MDKKKLTDEIKKYAIERGADLVGVAPVERFKNAPLRMSPKGHLPTAKSVVVFAVHHLDSAVELGGEPTPHDFGPYGTQSSAMNPLLDSIALNMARFIEAEGFDAIPMPVTNIWRYSPYKDIKESFAPDLVHRYAAVAAGLGEIGWSNLFLSPQYGPRQRINSVITDADLYPTPMYDGDPLCDRCMECVKACPSGALKKEISRINKLEIGEKVYEFPETNKWRCAWAENFALNLSLDIPEKVNKDVILKYLAKYGKRGGEAGSCLKYCMVPKLRYRDPEYTRAFRRKRIVKKASPEKITEKVKNMAIEADAEWIVVASISKIKTNLKKYLPDVRNIIVLGINYGDDQPSKTATNFILSTLQYKIARYLENLGYSTTGGFSQLSNDKAAALVGLWKLDRKAAKKFTYILTAAPMKEIKILPKKTGTKINKRKNLTKDIVDIAKKKGADLVGFSSAERLQELALSLRKIYKNERLLVVNDKNRPHGVYVPDGKEEKIKVKGTYDYLPEAKSVLVIGMHYPNAILDRAGKPPAEAMGPYAAHAQWSLTVELCSVGFYLIKYLEQQGYKSVATLDLCGLASHIYNPREAYSLYDATANRFAAFAAGLGEIGKHGVTITPQYGVRQRFLAVVTDAPLNENSLYSGEGLCKDCYSCQTACVVSALSKDKVNIKLNNKNIDFLKTDRLRCDWAKTYGLVGEEGPKYMGSKTNIMPPDKITLKNLSNALKKLDPIQKYHLCILEKCLSVCPGGRK